MLRQLSYIFYFDHMCSFIMTITYLITSCVKNKCFSNLLCFLQLNLKTMIFFFIFRLLLGIRIVKLVFKILMVVALSNKAGVFDNCVQGVVWRTQQHTLSSGASPGSVQVFESTNSFSSDLTGMVSYKPQRNAFVGGEVGFLAAEITR